MLWDQRVKYLCSWPFVGMITSYFRNELKHFLYLQQKYFARNTICVWRKKNVRVWRFHAASTEVNNNKKKSSVWYCWVVLVWRNDLYIVPPWMIKSTLFQMSFKLNWENSWIALCIWISKYVLEGLILILKWTPNTSAWMKISTSEFLC